MSKGRQHRRPEPVSRTSTKNEPCDADAARSSSGNSDIKRVKRSVDVVPDQPSTDDNFLTLRIVLDLLEA